MSSVIRSCGWRGPPRVKSRWSRRNFRSLAAEKVLVTSAKRSLQYFLPGQKFAVGDRVHISRLSASFSGEPHAVVIVWLFAFYRSLAGHSSVYWRFVDALACSARSPAAVSRRAWRARHPYPARQSHHDSAVSSIGAPTRSGALLEPNGIGARVQVPTGHVAVQVDSDPVARDLDLFVHTGSKGWGLFQFGYGR